MALAVHVPLSSQNNQPIIPLYSNFITQVPLCKSKTNSKMYCNNRTPRFLSSSVTCSSLKIVRDPSLDRHVVKQNKIRFVQKLKTLLLSKPKHYMALHILSKCRSYLSLSRPRSILSMIHRYPTIFELFTIPIPPTPLNATKPYSQLCVRLTPAAAALARQEMNLKSTISISLANKLQKLLMLSSHHRLLLSKLVHIAPDLGLPPNFRSRLCNGHPDKFRTVDTSYGRALELISWDPNLANPLPYPEVKSLELIVDRPLKFKQVRLRKGRNVKRRHQQFLIKFRQVPDVCPYKTPVIELVKESIEAEKRACAVVREVLGMMVEKRTLVDHLTHFRKEFYLPNKLRGMLVRHPELFYVSLKGQRDSVFLVEAYDEKGALAEKDEIWVIKDQLMELVREGKRIRRERRKGILNDHVENSYYETYSSDDSVDEDDDCDDGLDNLFDCEEEDEDDVDEEEEDSRGDLWTAEAASILKSEGHRHVESW